MICLAACSGLEESEKDRLRQKNAKGEYIYRHHDEVVEAPPPPAPVPRAPYPWEVV